ncbi:MAG: hypothetical protein WB699_10950 [Bacteroidota bacterium]
MIQRIQRRLAQLSELVRRVEQLQQAVGRIELRLSAGADAGKALRDYEFKVFSQWGEDGIIQHLIRTIPIPVPYFVEFGVQDYQESNTRFLLQNNNWSGLILEASKKDVEAIWKQMLYFRHDLKAVCAFVERENINQLLTENGAKGEIGLLSVDIDGNDYWVWEAIESVSPRIVICEYDNILGCDRAVVSPYDRAFDKVKAHYSFLYGGASLPALDHLARRKGYTLVGSNSAGNNAFFVRNDVRGGLKAVSPREVYTRAKYRSSRDREGQLTFLDYREGLRLIADMPLIDVQTGETLRVRDIIPPEER